MQCSQIAESYLRRRVVRGDLVQPRHLRPVGELLKDLEPQRQLLLDVRGFLPHLELLHL